MSIKATIELTETFALNRCSDCGLSYATPEAWQNQRRRDHKTFYCPNGHGQHYPAESDVEKLQRQLRAAQARATHAEDQRRAAERSLTAQKAATTRARRRAAHGVCPCCSRTFANVARHMTSQHPEFVAEHGGAS